VAVRASLPEEKHGLRFHDLRHTAASLMRVQPELALEFIVDQLGHADVRMTMNRYGHRLASADESARSVRERAWGTAQSLFAN
jgi:integrase